jgi:hypothetical protein
MCGWKVGKLVVLSLLSATLGTAAARAQTHVIQGRAVTGVNRLLGQPVFELGPFGGVGFSDVGAYDPKGVEAQSLTAKSPASTVLASLVDPGFLDLFHVDPGTVNPATLNVPLRDIGVYADPTGRRQPIRDILSSPQLAPSRASIGGPITLGQWLSARGIAQLRCFGHLATLRLDMTGLVARGLYDVWGVMLTAQGPAPICLGGSPCAFSTDDLGNATFTANLNFCPYALRSNEVPLGLIEILFHSDHALYGSQPELFYAGNPPGTVSHSQLEFPVSATPAD